MPSIAQSRLSRLHKLLNQCRSCLGLAMPNERRVVLGSIFNRLNLVSKPDFMQVIGLLIKLSVT